MANTMRPHDHTEPGSPNVQMHREDKRQLQELNKRLGLFVNNLPAHANTIKQLREQLKAAESNANRKLETVSREFERRLDDVKNRNFVLKAHNDDLDTKLKKTIDSLKTKEAQLADRTSECKKYQKDLVTTENLLQGKRVQYEECNTKRVQLLRDLKIANDKQESAESAIL